MFNFETKRTLFKWNAENVKRDYNDEYRFVIIGNVFVLVFPMPCFCSIDSSNEHDILDIWTDRHCCYNVHTTNPLHRIGRYGSEANRSSNRTHRLIPFPRWDWNFYSWKMDIEGMWNLFKSLSIEFSKLYSNSILVFPYYLCIKLLAAGMDGRLSSFSEIAV